MILKVGNIKRIRLSSFDDSVVKIEAEDGEVFSIEYKTPVAAEQALVKALNDINGVVEEQ